MTTTNVLGVVFVGSPLHREGIEVIARDDGWLIAVRGTGAGRWIDRGCTAAEVVDAVQWARERRQAFTRGLMQRWGLVPRESQR